MLTVSTPRKLFVSCCMGWMRMVLQELTDLLCRNREKYMVVVPMVIGVAIAFLNALSLALVYIPSVTATILQLRCGIIPTLRDKNFNIYRHAPDQVALITGSLFWGSLVSSILVGGVVGMVIFLFLWQATAYYAQILVATLIGIISVTLLRLCLVCFCRATLYKSFYRKKPAMANIAMLALEWANFTLSVGFIFIRVVKLLLAASTGIGRIDTPIISPNVGRFGPLNLDNYPMVHLKDLLSHEVGNSVWLFCAYFSSGATLTLYGYSRTCIQRPTAIPISSNWGSYTL